MIIGTAGHVDHGKTALVKALTGVDCDRLEEEKARGVTIELGFAYLPTPDGHVLGFVDVPGHERFVRTMVAGASGIDFALLVVAADEGVKPQTREHLAIVDLLGVGQGLAVLSKADLVTPERLAEAAAELAPLLAGTALEGPPLAVSAATGQGIDTLRDHLAATAAALSARSAESRFRLAVDRAFILQGVGVVVTGTVLSGTVQVGDQLVISPSGLPVRVRSLHAQNQPAEIGRAGDRCALNLAGPGVARAAVGRGDMVLDPVLHAPTDRIDARLRVLPGESKPVGQWFPVRLHHAAVEVGARIVVLGDAPIEPGGEGDVQLVLDRPIAAATHDRFVLRDVSARRTIGGGRFIDLRGPQRRRRTPERRRQLAALALADPTEAFVALLEAPPFAFDLFAFAHDHALSAAQTEQLASRTGVVRLQAGAVGFALSTERWGAFTANLLAGLAAYHAENPDLQGVGRERLRLQLQPRLPVPVFIAALQRLAGAGKVRLDGGFVRLASHVARLTPGDEAAWAAIAPLLGGAERFRPPRVRDLAETTGRGERDVRRLLKLAGRMGWADEIAPDHFFLRATVREMIALCVEAAEVEGGEFTAAQFRDRVANGRKVAIQVLEFFDRHGVTLRRGDLRRINPHRLDLFGAHGRESSLVGRSDFKSEWGSEPVPGGFDSHSLPPPPSRSGP